MDTQKNLMMLTVVVAIIFGVWFLFAPNTYNSVMGIDLTTVSVGWAIFGIGGLYIVGSDFALSNPFTIQSIIFIVISIAYYALKTPKQA